jgi:ABC-type antimicrobial peptide transport system permease subunit
VSLSLVVRSSGDHAALVSAMRQVLLSIDRDIPLYRVRTLAQALEDAAWNGRVSSNLIHVLAGLALGLSMVGLYAVTAHAARRRSREIGVRMALGARPRDIQALILRKAGIQVATGFAAGVACTFVWGWMFASSQAGITITNFQSLAMTGIVLAVVAAIATLVPVRRATRVNPVTVLRHE